MMTRAEASSCCRLGNFSSRRGLPWLPLRKLQSTILASHAGEIATLISEHGLMLRTRYEADRERSDSQVSSCACETPKLA